MDIYIKTRIEIDVRGDGLFYSAYIYNHVLKGTPAYRREILETFKGETKERAENKAKAWLHNNGIINLED